LNPGGPGAKRWPSASWTPTSGRTCSKRIHWRRIPEQPAGWCRQVVIADAASSCSVITPAREPETAAVAPRIGVGFTNPLYRPDTLRNVGRACPYADTGCSR
jgi:hypothetical protein